MPISPNQGQNSGGTTITITGVNLAGTTNVFFGINNATITANTPTMVTVVDPAGSGAVDVVVETRGGKSNPLKFYYISYPIVTGLDQISGPTAGGNTVNIYGYNLSTASSVSFGSNSATPTVINDSQISVVAPAGAAAGTVNVYVITTGGQSLALEYTYTDAPTIIALSPTSGPTTGGTLVTISGTNLANTISVSVGGSTSSFSIISSTTISIITPSGTAGAADVVVTTTGGSATAVGGYTYVAGPGI
jgi:hypothetical protein